MKREDIYIEVTPETIGAYEEVLRRHGERIGDTAVREHYTKLQYSGTSWWVLRNVHSNREYLPATPEEFDKWLTDLKAAEASVEGVADTSVESAADTSVEGVADTSVESAADTSVESAADTSVEGNVVPIELDERAQLYAKNGDTLVPVTLCPGLVVVRLQDGTKTIASRSDLYQGTLKPI